MAPNFLRHLASENTYHPTLEQAVAAARSANVTVVASPVLLRLDCLNVKPEHFFRDIASSRREPCSTCIAAHLKCVLHNVLSYRCLGCWMGGSR